MQIQSLINRGALFVVNHSGGKDSQCMLIHLARVIPRQQLLVIHATLGDIEWPGALELARDQAAALGVPFLVAQAGKSFLDMVERRYAARPDVPSWPSAQHRQCTSDLKRDPINREIRRYMRDRGLSLVVSCTGIRAAESAARARLDVFKRNARNSTAGREWYDWAPIHGLSTAQVFATIVDAGRARRRGPGRRHVAGYNSSFVYRASGSPIDDSPRVRCATREGKPWVTAV